MKKRSQFGDKREGGYGNKSPKRRGNPKFKSGDFDRKGKENDKGESRGRFKSRDFDNDRKDSFGERRDRNNPRGFDHRNSRSRDFDRNSNDKRRDRFDPEKRDNDRRRGKFSSNEKPRFERRDSGFDEDRKDSFGERRDRNNARGFDHRNSRNRDFDRNSNDKRRDRFDPERRDNDRRRSKFSSNERPRFERRDSGFDEDRNDRRSSSNRRNNRRFTNNRVGSSVRPDYLNAYKPKKDFRKKDEEKHVSDEIRLNRYIANSGVCSRREADDLIANGQIKVNGEIVTEMGFKVKKADKVTFKGRRLSREKPVYILLNKPKGFITTMNDPEGRKTVMELVEEACEERVYPVGRLDRDTTGLLLLTNDGQLAKELAHPSGKTKKIYNVELDRPITENDFNTIVQRKLVLEDGPVDLDGISIINPDKTQIGVELHSGKNRIVRRIFEHFGYKIMKLDRTVYAGLTKIDLPRSKWRFLSEKELVRLKHMNIRK